MRIKLVLFFLVYLTSTKIVTTQNLGDPCIDKNNLSGTCELIFKCKNVMSQKYNGGSYTRCGFSNGREIVCCAQRTITPVESVDISLLKSKKYVQQCEEFKTKSFDTDLYLTRLSLPTKQTTSNCSQYTFPLVVNGENALPREFPHMAQVGCQSEKNGKYIWGCGGTLISPYYVLTAAHCFEPTDSCPKAVDVVRLGDLNTENDTDDAQPKDYKIARVIPHPTYNSSIKYNDIGLIKLETKVDFTPYIRPACLPYVDYNNQSQLVVTGWGHRQLAGKTAAHLQKAPVVLFAHEECDEVYNEEEDASLPVGIKVRTQICAGSYNEEKPTDTCQGDSGGPLQTVHTNHPCMYTVIGVTSYGQACGISGIPGVYTRVYNYNEWIESVVWDE